MTSRSSRWACAASSLDFPNFKRRAPHGSGKRRRNGARPREESGPCITRSDGSRPDWVALSGVLVAGPLARADVLIGAATVFAGPEAQIGEQVLRGAQMAVEDLNAAGGVLGQKLKLSVVDDACEGSQAVAAAQKLVSEGVVFVVGHLCSAAAIPASEVYEKAGVLEISPAATNPKLTEQGRDNVFRVIGRDDQQGAMAADYIAHHWPNAKIAVVHDGTTYGEGLGAETKRELNRAGVSEILFESIIPGKADHPELMARLQAAGVTVLFFGGYGVEAGILARNAHDMGLKIQFVGGDGLDTSEFIQAAGPAGEGAIFTAQADARRNPAAADVVERFRKAGFEPEGVDPLHLRRGPDLVAGRREGADLQARQGHRRHARCRIRHRGRACPLRRQRRPQASHLRMVCLEGRRLTRQSHDVGGNRSNVRKPWRTLAAPGGLSRGQRACGARGRSGNLRPRPGRDGS